MARRRSGLAFARVFRRVGALNCVWSSRLGVWLCGAMALLFLAEPRSARAISPDDPKVQSAIKRGLDYLTAAASYESRLGGKALAGLAQLKAGNRDHPNVAHAIEAIRKTLDTTKYARGEPYAIETIYSLGIALVFMAELHDSAYQSEIERLVAALEALQKPHGGWGYAHYETGDTSMSQNAVLGLWSAAQVGVSVTPDVIERACEWLLRTQDPTGPWGYQGQVGSLNKLVSQNEIRPTMALAAMGSLYICAAHLGAVKIKDDGDGPPPELVKVDQKNPTGKSKSAFTTTQITQALARGRAWLAAYGDNAPEAYRAYYYYSQERYQTLLGLATGTRSMGPWYDRGCEHLLSTQLDDGRWDGHEGPVSATAFSILFLIRSTQKAVERFVGLGAGTLVGGRGLPSGDGDVRLRMGQLTAKPLLGPAEELFSKLQDPGDGAYLEATEALRDLTLRGEADDRLNVWQKQLLELAGGDSSEAKAAAIEALAKTRDLDFVPVLIEALADEDEAVYQAAKDGLQFIRRDLVTKRVPGRPDAAAVEQEIRVWRAWFRSIRPSVRFDE